jgi:DNA-binding NarL/FixJ family response regulator
MGIEIPSVALSNASVAARSASNSASVQPKPVQPPAHVSEDTIRLTAAQQVYQLYNQGQTVSQIASNLRLSVAVVNGYLNLPNSGS